MKHLYKFSLLLLAFLLPATAIAYDFEVDGIYYNINGNEAIVSFSLNGYSGDLTIPATVTYGGTTYSVTSIGDGAFYECTGLTRIDMVMLVRLLQSRNALSPMTVTELGM